MGPSDSGAASSLLLRSRVFLRRVIATGCFLFAVSVQAQNTFSSAWQPVGPGATSSISYGAVSGRVISVAVDPNDATGNTVYIGTAGGGVWKSVNAASTPSSIKFSPLTDTLSAFGSGYKAVPSLFIGALAVQPVANPVLLAVTGDANNSVDSYYGEGILRSADNGLSWSLTQIANDLPNALETFNGLSAAALAWSTATPSVAVAAFTISPQAVAVQANQNTSIPGLYYTTDAGATWHMATVYDGTSVVQQPKPILAGSNQGNAATSVVWNAQRKLFFAVLQAHGYYTSSDGMTWKRLDVQPGTGMSSTSCPTGANGLGSSASCPVYRGTLAVQPVTGDTYAWTVDANSSDQGLWQDQCSLNSSGACANSTPAFSKRLDGGALDDAGTSHVSLGLSTLSLGAFATASGETNLFAGAADLYHCVLAPGATACVFRNATDAANGCATPAGVAPGFHALAGWPQVDGTTGVILGTDGGLWASPDAIEEGPACSADDANHFENLNMAITSGGSTAQVVGFAQNPVDANTLLAGLGSNGTASIASSTSAMWAQLSAGDGGFPHIDQTNPNHWYAAIGLGVNLKHCASGTSCGSGDFAAPATVGPAQVGSDASLHHAPTLLDPAEPDNLLVGTCRVWRGPADDGTRWSSSNAISAPIGSSAPCTSASPLIRSIAAGGPVATSSDAQHNGSTVLYAGMAGLLDGGNALGGHLFITSAADKASGTTQWLDISGGTVTNASAAGGVFNPAAFSVSSVFVDPHDASGGTVYATILGFGEPHLYWSTDFGKHWLNVSSNLPDVPANSVVVDPNDANTVYIALDSGVYATTAISTCASANCWSILGTGLPNSPITQLRAGAELSTVDNRLGMLRASTYGRGIWQTPLLKAISVAAPALSVSPASLMFGTQQAETQSNAQTVTVTSTGNAPAAVASVSVSTGFSEADTCSGKTLSVGDTCSVQVRFAPSTTGDVSGLLTVYANISGGQVTASLSGSGTAPASITLTPNAVSFPATIVNQTSATQNVVIANTGQNSATLQPAQLTGDFNIVANTCSSTLAAQTACTLSLQFMPTDRGTRTGLLTVTDSAGTQTASLTGTGNSPATDTLGISSLSFTQQAVGTTSSTQQVTLTNAGDTPLFLSSVGVTGDFLISNDCGTSLPGRATCAIIVSFAPNSVGARSGTLTIVDEFRTQTVGLTGVGVAPAGVSLTPSALMFPNTGVGLSAPVQSITLTNNGGLPLALSKTSVSGDFAIVSSACGAMLAANAACSMTVVFTPTVAGQRTGAVILADNAPSAVQQVSLQGTGVDFTLVASGATSQTLSSGGTATYELLIGSVPGLSGNIAFSCSGAPAHAACNANPGVVSLGQNTDVLVTVQTGLSTASAEPMLFPWSGSRFGLAALICFLPIVAFRRKRRGLALLMLIVAFVSLSGCGTPRTIPSAGGSGGSVVATPTPAGTYTLTLTGTTAGISHSVPLTLVVQ